MVSISFVNTSKLLESIIDLCKMKEEEEEEEGEEEEEVEEE